MVRRICHFPRVVATDQVGPVVAYSIPGRYPRFRALALPCDGRDWPTGQCIPVRDFRRSPWRTARVVALNAAPRRVYPTGGEAIPRYDRKKPDKPARARRAEYGETLRGIRVGQSGADLSLSGRGDRLPLLFPGRLDNSRTLLYYLHREPDVSAANAPTGRSGRGGYGSCQTDDPGLAPLATGGRMDRRSGQCPFTTGGVRGSG